MRKRVLIKAAESAGVTLELKRLPGHIGIVFTGQDPIEVTKLVFKYSPTTTAIKHASCWRTYRWTMYTGEDVRNAYLSCQVKMR